MVLVLCRRKNIITLTTVETRWLEWGVVVVVVVVGVILCIEPQVY
jgi:hypothetical protein